MAFTRIENPRDFVALASEWHGGISSMMYAFTSCGNLQPGTQRPWNHDEDRPMSDPEWQIHLWDCLADEIRHDAEWCADNPDAEESADLDRLMAFLEFAEQTAANLRMSAGGSDSGVELQNFTSAYIETAIWSSTDDEGEPMDRDHGPSDIAPDTLEQMRRDCAEFVAKAGPDIYRHPDGPARAGHDFWLTRNEHGRGFWDGDWPEPAASRLDSLSKEFGQVDLYIGDDGKIHGI